MSTNVDPKVQSPADQPRVPSAEVAIRALRHRRAKRLAAKLSAFVLLPTLVAAGYYAFWASDAYESVALFSIQAAEQRPSMAMESLIGIAGVSAAGRDTLAARDYVLSREMLDVLDERVQLLDHYRSSSLDFFSRLATDASREEAYEYYLDRVQLSFDSNSSVLTLRVRAYDAEMAHRVADTILKACEDKVNRLSEKARQDQIRYAQSDVEKAEKRLAESRQRLVEVQQKYGEFSPADTAQAALTIRTELETELARARAQYATLSSYMAKNSPQVVAAQEKVKSLSAQAVGETRRLVNPKQEQGLNRSFIEFESVQVEKEFATQAYQSALSSLELARAEAARQHRYLAPIASPSKPDEATFPRRILLVFTTFITSLVLFGIGSLGIAAIKEHARL